MYVDVYLHSSKEDMYDKGKKLGLSKEALQTFMYTAYEEKLTYYVTPDGRSELHAVNGRKLI